jgi:hypothetical protein
MKTCFRASLLAILVAAALPALAGEDFIYATREGDNLWDISTRLLRNPADWQILQKKNAVAEPRHLPVGFMLRIPKNLLRFDAAPARVAVVRGDARRTSGQLQEGATLSSGEEVVTGKDSYVALDLADGSRLVLQPESKLRLDALQGAKGAGIYRTRLDLRSGRVENQVAKQQDTESGYRLRTPAAVIAVRGTGFRVAAESDKQARAEVTEGVVKVRGGKGKRAVAVSAGEGLVVTSDAPIVPAVPLLLAPDLSGLPPILDRVLVRLSFPALAGAVGYRAQLAEDEAFRRIVADGVFQGPVAKFSGVADGKLWLRVRGVAENGLEGLDAVRAVTLKARPEPPFASLPKPAGKVRGEAVNFQWTNAEGAASYDLQVASCGDFSQPVQEAKAIAGTSWQSGKLPPGNYAWRVASVRADGDHGPYGDGIPFELRPMPANPEAPKLDGNQMDFAWPAEPGQRFELELARDSKFADAPTQLKLDEPRVSLPRPDAGIWFMRVRATDPDGFVGPWTATQSFEGPARPWWLLLGLLPLVL